ncbi:MAG: hypothetical protein HWE35_03485 [Rhodobacteraceae bacterium]|nr:hypothetical protein [Paracoccaceae bacterium]
MALKVTSGAWSDAAKENQQQRDALRRAFFSQAGVPVAASLRQVFLSPASRITNAASLAQHVLSPRIEDANLPAAATAALQAAEAVGLAVPALPQHFDIRPHSIAAHSPEVLRSFFTEDQETGLEMAMF